MSKQPNAQLYPLVVEDEYLVLETEIKQSFIEVYNRTIGKSIIQLLSFGMPYLLDDKEVLNWFLLHEGLSLPTNNVNIGNLKYLMKAWEGERHKRGTDFLHTILQCLYPNEYKLEQMYQEKAQTYPTSLVNKEEASKNPGNYYLTSRLVVEVTDMDEAGEYLIAYQNALQKMISAKFVLELTLLRSFGGEASQLGMASGGTSMNFIDFEFQLKRK